MSQPRISATTIKTWRRCERLYFWKYVEKLPVEKTPALEFGIAMHAALEAHLRGQPVPEAWRPIVQPALEHLQVEGERLIEHRFEVPIFGGVITGQLDFAYAHPHDDHAHVIDFKSTSDFKYALSEEEAARDPQTVIYGKVAADYFGKPLGSFTYLYLHKQRPGARLVRTLPDEGAWGRLREEAKQIVWKVDSSPRAYRANPNACGDFGGCPFKSQCGKLGDGPMGFLAKLGAPAPAPTLASAPAPVAFDPLRAPAAPTPTPAAPTPAPSPAVAPVPVSAAEAERRAMIEKLVAAGRDRADMERRNLVELAILTHQLKDPVNPPDGTPRTVAGEAPPKKEVEKVFTLPDTDIVVAKAKLEELLVFFAKKAGVDTMRVDKVRKAASLGVAELRADVVKLLSGGQSDVLTLVGGPDDVPERAPRAKKEPKEKESQEKDERTAGPVTAPAVTAPAVVAPAVVAPAAPVSPEPAPTVTAPVAPVTAPTVAVSPEASDERWSPPLGVTLYVNCALVRGSGVQSLDELVAPIVRDVERAVGNEAFYGAIDYGKGPALVAAGLQKAIENDELDIPAEVVVDLRERYAADCLSVLRRLLPNVREFRGFV